MESALPDRLVDAYEVPWNAGPMPAPGPTHVGEALNESCGDCCKIELRCREPYMPAVAGWPGGVIDLAHHQSTGCIISRAAASLLAEFVQGRPLSAVQLIDEEGMRILFDCPVAPLRMKCVLLPLQALRAALDSPIPQAEPAK